jgi:hypothetical protein
MVIYEDGWVITKRGRGWGITYQDARETCYGWVDLPASILFSSRVSAQLFLEKRRCESAYKSKLREAVCASLRKAVSAELMGDK